jgi:hypothetical protein
MEWKTCGYVIVAAVGLVAVDNAAAAEEMSPQETGYEQEHTRRPDIWAEQMTGMLEPSS